MSEPIRILFVDDEPQVLQGLMRLFRPHRQLWRVRTAGSGAEALAALAAEPAEVVVSDMRMPGMDGAELLAQVRERHPGMVRIMLSGQADNEGAIVRAGPCHHFIAKPCDHDRLVAVATRSVSLRRELADPALSGRLAKHPSLPTLPRLWHAMLDELATTEPSLHRLAGLIAQDPATAARLLRVVNSAAFGLERTVDSVTDAVALLGLGAVRAMVLAVHVHDGCLGDGAAAEAMWTRSLVAARSARAIAKAHGADQAGGDAAFTAGLLHDCGLLLLLSGFPAVAAASLAAAQDGRDRIAAECAAGGPPHDLAGAWLLLRWGLPDSLVEAAAWHHRAPQDPDPLSPLAAVATANALLESADHDPQLVARVGGEQVAAKLREMIRQVLP